MDRIVERARELADAKHGGLQIPDKLLTPMMDHISEVAALVEGQGGTEVMIAATWLHDVGEDSDVTLEQIGEWFGPEVHTLVDGLTDPEDFAPKPLEERKRLQAERIQNLSEDVKRIKLCDQLSNVQRVLAKPPLDWSAEEQFTYIQGARKIVMECRGLWPALDEQFDAAYATAQRRFTRA